MRIVSRSHHLHVCLSAPEPSAAILSLYRCTQHIPGNHTHACMHADTHLRVKCKNIYNTKRCKPGLTNTSSITQGLHGPHWIRWNNVIKLGSRVKSRKCGNTLRSGQLVRWWEIGFYRVPYFIYLSFKPLYTHQVTFTHSIHTRFISACSFAEHSSKKWISSTHKRVFKFLLVDSCWSRKCHRAWDTHRHTHTQLENTCAHPGAILTSESPPNCNNTQLLPMNH